MTSYTVWRLVDSDQNLWLPTNCDTFEQAADAWLDCVRAGEAARITEDVPVALQDARRQPRPEPRNRGPKTKAIARTIAVIDGVPPTSRLYDVHGSARQALLAMLEAGGWTTPKGSASGWAAAARMFPKWIERDGDQYRLSEEGRIAAVKLRDAPLYAA